MSMATSLDIRLIPKVRSIIDRLGKNVTVTDPSAGVYDPETGEVTGATDSSFTTKATPPFPYENALINGTTILQGDARVYFPAQNLGFVPDRDQIVSVDNVVWQVVSVGRIYSGELVALWEVQLRR